MFLRPLPTKQWLRWVDDSGQQPHSACVAGAGLVAAFPGCDLSTPSGAGFYLSLCGTVTVVVAMDWLPEPSVAE